MKIPISHLIDVYGDFDFVDSPVRIGRLHYDRLRGRDVYSFRFHSPFLLAFPGIPLSYDLSFHGLESFSSGAIFRCFGDCLPDRWGRALIDKRERLRVGANGVPRVFDDFGYLMQLDDRCRMGAFRFVKDGVLVGRPDPQRNIPIIEDIRSLVWEAQRFEESLKDGKPLRMEWVDNLWRQGSSLGGVRPKANVVDEGGNLCIAKFPSINDVYDIALWEHFASRLAASAGIETADTRLLAVPGFDNHALLSRRFDRVGSRRVHYASALTLTGLRDGDNASNGKGYLDIVNAVIGGGFAEPSATLSQLFRRVAFNICIGNHDDHFRNHGFLLTKEGWRLSPAFDMNPTNSLVQSLLINESTSESSLPSLLSSCESYFLEIGEARRIVSEVLDAVSRWRVVADSCGISRREQERFAARFSKHVLVGMSRPVRQSPGQAISLSEGDKAIVGGGFRREVSQGEGKRKEREKREKKPEAPGKKVGRRR